jgi:hypothetical protein
VGPSHFNLFFQYSNSTQTGKLIMEAFPCSNNTQTLHGARFEHFEQLSQLGHFKFPIEFMLGDLE